uniref:Gag-pol polyprotein n=1 Tax=Solanum tuberosum TaxID=4113 RepID=M1E009_SOLTU
MGGVTLESIMEAITNMGWRMENMEEQLATMKGGEPREAYVNQEYGEELREEHGNQYQGEFQRGYYNNQVGEGRGNYYGDQGGSGDRDVGINFNNTSLQPFKGECYPDAYLEWESLSERILQVNDLIKVKKSCFIIGQFEGFAIMWWQLINSQLHLIQY